MVSCMIEHHGSGPGPLRYMYIPFLLQCMLEDEYKSILDKLKLVFVNGNGLVRAITDYYTTIHIINILRQQT